MRIFNEHPAFKSDQNTHWKDLTSSGLALALTEVALDHDGLIVVITNSAQEAAYQRGAIEFFSKDQNLPILIFPDWETLPYDIFSPHQDIISARLKTLAKLPNTQQGILLVPITTIMHRLAPIDFVSSRSFHYQVGDRLDRDKLQNQLSKVGYNRVDIVYEHGEFAFRGSIIDIFPMGAKLPFRLDLLDTEIESLRQFDPESQRTIESVQRIDVLPAREFPLDKQSINIFLNRWHDCFDHNPKPCPVYRDVKEGIAPQGIEYYSSLFFEETSSLFDYLPKNSLLFTLNDIETTANRFWNDITTRYIEYGVDPERPLLQPSAVFFTVDKIFHKIKVLPCTKLKTVDVAIGTGNSISPVQSVPNVSVNVKLANPLSKLESFIKSNFDSNKGLKVLFCAESPGRREVLADLLKNINLRPTDVQSWTDFLQQQDNFYICTFPLNEGIYCPKNNLCLITESDLFGQQVMQRRRRSATTSSPDYVFKSLAELKLNAPVVHIEHGVGRYKGLVTLEVDKTTQEFLMLTYANDAKLYVPVSSLHLISRFGGGDQSTAPLNHLGSDKWDKAKQRAAQQVRDTAVELLDIYSRRAARNGFSCLPNEQDYLSFSSDFTFEETADQQQAIDAVRNDLLSPQPMDRLVCGDVGFGKTEVAMRAAFTAVSSGKQVVILVPTTLLAHQHLQNFQDRFSNWPVVVEELSRFKTNKQQNQVIAAAEQGNVDILISTHKLLYAEINFKNLGLMIIDEEHRFGVRQKEKIKSYRTEIDILTMTATPIPRTLNMSMHSIRDLSIIATPPAKRLSVKTFVRKYESRVVREAALREILRGGQVYYLHNDVKSIQRVADELSELIPEATINIAHGQMREKNLEQVMSDFYHQRFNILVCTTIIETGIDIPSANTILIDRADKFGLAQLHQLRGRVGRSHHQAYAYLMLPKEKRVTPDANKRLQAISAADQLGSGFTLATNDLEIRGAGELLGEEQSGHIQTIGFTLYLEMLDKAITALKDGKTLALDASLENGLEVNMHLPALIPDDYLPDTNMRLTLYKRISDCKTSEDLHELQVEMIDRFGLLPETTKTLFKIAEVKQIGTKLGLKKIEAGPKGGRLQFTSNTPVEPITIIKMIQNEPDIFRLKNNDQLSFNLSLDDAENRFIFINNIFDKLLARQ